ncbi:MAG: hypothetical protein ABSD64_14830 [Terriglobales bacterium]|jgi:hypothetical protein
MTTSALRENQPFLLRFARPVAEEPSLPLRYDAARQITQVLQNGQWIDAPDSPNETAGATRKTAVGGETTDDE